MAVTLKCPKHPRYTAKIAPRANCQACIDLYDFKMDFQNSLRPKQKARKVPEGYIDGLAGPIALDY